MLVTPSATMKIGDKSYHLDGSFTTLRSVQEAMNKDILHVLLTIPDMRLDQIVQIIAIASGGKVEEIGEAIIDSVGAATPEYALLKTEVFAWLNVAIVPKGAREKKKAEMEQLIAAQTSSLGTTTSASASAS